MSLERTSLKPDPFGHKAPKLAVLLGQSAAARVLVAGTSLSNWHEDFASYFEDLLEAPSAADVRRFAKEEKRFDLILCALDSVSDNHHDLSRVLGDLRRMLSEGGTLILLAENRFALSRLAKNPASVFRRGRTTRGNLQRCLNEAGFEHVEEFLPLPRFAGAEEFVSVRYGEAALPSDASSIEFALNHLGLLPTFSDGWCEIGCGAGGGVRSLLDRTARHLREQGLSTESLVLERFDLRDRGALVLMLHEVNRAGRFVCRITTDQRSDRSVRLNADWTEQLHRAETLSASIKSLIPRPLGRFRLNNGMQYIEELIDGSIAWKLAGNRRLEPVMFSEMCKFASDLDRQSGRNSAVDSWVFDRLSQSPHALSMDPETASLSHDLTRRLRERTVGRERRLVWAHGDFGYGNAIADRKTGKIVGLIDWDQAREDLAGVDLVNFLVIREHSRAQSPLTTTFKRVADRLAKNGLEAFNPSAPVAHNSPLEIHELVETIPWVALRITQRAATYPALLARSRAQIHSILRWACDRLSQ